MKKIIYFSILLFGTLLSAQENINYQQPPQDILDLVDVQRAPSVRIDDAKTYMVLLSRDPFKSIAELSKEELRLAGLRIDPRTNIRK